jgi:hypothetical protein
LPRLSKVSKPVAMAVDKLETYSVVIIVILMRIFAVNDPGIQESTTLLASPYLTAGVTSIPIDIVLAIASAINILVINGVKLFCELAIWLTPIPLVDVTVEVINKGLCVGLISLYCWSPLVATIVNLILLAICASVYLWTQRRIVYYLDLIAGPFLKRWLPWLFASNADGEIVFLVERWNAIPKLTKLRLKGSADQGWTLTRRRWWGTTEHSLPSSRPISKTGLLATTIELADDSGSSVEFHQRLSGQASSVAAFS